MKRNLSMCWIDYKKAFDMVPHSWIKEVLNDIGIAENLKALLFSSMERWQTVLTFSSDVLGEVDIKRGIFQGDSLSPLLFIICIIPLTMIMRRECLGYSFGPYGYCVNHLLYMDDLKLFASSENELEALVHIVSVFSRDIGMEFGVEKCAVLHIERGEKTKVCGMSLPNGRMMKELEDEGYRYLGVIEGAGIHHKEMKEKVKEEYFRRVKCIAKSRLYSGNLIRGINTWAVFVVQQGSLNGLRKLTGCY